MLYQVTEPPTSAPRDQRVAFEIGPVKNPTRGSCDMIWGGNVATGCQDKVRKRLDSFPNHYMDLVDKKRKTQLIQIIVASIIGAIGITFVVLDVIVFRRLHRVVTPAK